MSFELSIPHERLIAITANNNLSSVLEPLVKEILLYDTFIAGTTHLKDKSVLGEIAVGDLLTLIRENNKFDEKAILVFFLFIKKLGYIPERDNLIFSRLMDAGKKLSAKITDISVRDGFHRISIEIYLIDY